MTRFNIIGFGNASSPWHPRKTCPMHHAVLVPKRNESGDYEPGMLQCPLCGSTYSEKEAPNQEGISVKHGQQGQTAIISGKRKKRYFDKQGNEINPDDKDTLDLIRQGYNITYYHEEKTEDNRPGTKRKIIR
jgi:hypothetical protein